MASYICHGASKQVPRAIRLLYLPAALPQMAPTILTSYNFLCITNIISIILEKCISGYIRYLSIGTINKSVITSSMTQVSCYFIMWSLDNEKQIGE